VEEGLPGGLKLERVPDRDPEFERKIIEMSKESINIE